NQQFFLTRTGPLDVDRRKHPFVRDLAIENNFRVTSTLELLEHHLIHAAPGFDQRGSDDGERAALLNVACRTKEALRPLQGVRIDTTGEHLARRRNDGIV